METYLDAMEDYVRGVQVKDARLRAKIDVAARCFNLEDTPQLVRGEKGREAAVFLKEILDRIAIIKLEDIPDTADTLSWRLADSEIVILKVESGPRKGEFLFAPDTTYRLADFYQEVRDLPYIKGAGKGAFYKPSWKETKIPKWAQEDILIMPLWQWSALLIAIFVGLLIKSFVQFILRLLNKRLWKGEISYKRKILMAVERPMGLLIATLFWIFLVYSLDYQGNVLWALNYLMKALIALSFVWGIYLLTYVLDDYLGEVAKTTESDVDDQLFPMIAKALRVLVLVLGVLLSVQNLGFNVMSVLAGLGLGGLALALAAQDSAANLFGSIMILLDRPFKVGDWIKVGSWEGMVEHVGFRSTRIRTFYNSVITVPNSTMAKENIDNMGIRGLFRVRTSLGVTYDTPPEKLEAFMEGLKNILLANPKVRKDKILVIFDRYADFSLEILVNFYFELEPEENEYVQKHFVYMEFLRMAHDMGVSFAFPTQSLHLESTPEKSKQVENAPTEDLLGVSRSYGPSGAKSRPLGGGVYRPLNPS